MDCARLTRYGLLSVIGPDARDFLHAQLTIDMKQLGSERAAFAGWCSAKGRLLATFLVVPQVEGFLLQLSRDLAGAVAKRLSMFVLRSKVKIADESEAWAQFGVWDAEGPATLTWERGEAVVPMGERRYLRLQPTDRVSLVPNAAEEAWTLQEIRAGRPWISVATQDQFVPQMVNLETLGAVDFKKGCYPGQEIVARAQYRGQVKRHMVRLPAPEGRTPRAGEELNGGVVVDGALGEVLAVLPD